MINNTLSIGKTKQVLLVKLPGYLLFNNCKYSFKHKHLVQIINNNTFYVIPKSNQGWWLSSKVLLTHAKAKELFVKEPFTINISHLQWYLQECFINGFYMDFFYKNNTIYCNN